MSAAGRGRGRRDEKWKISSEINLGSLEKRRPSWQIPCQASVGQHGSSTAQALHLLTCSKETQLKCGMPLWNCEWCQRRNGRKLPLWFKVLAARSDVIRSVSVGVKKSSCFMASLNQICLIFHRAGCEEGTATTTTTTALIRLSPD